MPQTLRYHLDEHVPGAIAVGLRRRGINVTTAADARLLGAGDAAHLAFALGENRVAVAARCNRAATNSQGLT
jgi:hypothetical protein